MSQTSHRFNLPYIMPSQAQKHVTHNESVRALDTLIHASVKSRSVAEAPQDPAEGDSYLIPEGGLGAFTGKTNSLAAFIDGAWMLYPPLMGLIVNIEDEGVCAVWRGQGWDELGASAEIDIAALSFDTFGINSAADEFNRLVLKSHASLFDHDGAGHQLKINKSAQSDTASIVYQNGYSGRAEMGLAGEDDFSFKVSPDGSNWTQALHINASNGAVSFPATRDMTRNVIFNKFRDGGRFGGTPEPLDVRLNMGFAAPAYIRSYNGSVLGEGAKFIENSNNFGGTRGTMPSHMEGLVAKMKPGASTTVRRYSTELYTLSVTAGSGTSGAITVDGVTAYLAIAGLRFPLPKSYTLSFWVLPVVGSCIISTHAQTRTFVDGVEISSPQLLVQGSWTLITRVVSYKIRYFTGYDSSPYKLYLSPGGAFELAAPVLFPGHVFPDISEPDGIVSSLTAV